MKSSILPEKLKSFDYYVNKLPLFLQNSYGFIEHYRIWYNLLISENEYEGISNVSDIILYLLDIFDKDYLTTLRDMPLSGSTSDDDYGYASDVLDKIGQLFGVTRNFTCTYTDQSQEISEALSLNNNDFLVLIKCQIIKNYCEATFEQLKQYYESAGLYTMIRTTKENGEYVPASSQIYLFSNQDIAYSENIRKMFLAGMLRIESMGINYSEFYSTLSGLLTWDSIIGNEIWDEGAWAK